MTDGTRRLEGWKEIAATVGKSEDTVRRAAVRPFDPLPVWYDAFRTPFSTMAAMESWVKRNTLPAPAYQALLENGLLPAQRGDESEADVALGSDRVASGQIGSDRVVAASVVKRPRKRAPKNDPVR